MLVSILVTDIGKLRFLVTEIGLEKIYGQNVSFLHHRQHLQLAKLRAKSWHFIVVEVNVHAGAVNRD